MLVMIEIKEQFRYRLEKALALRQMKPSDLSRLTQISEATISQYRSGYSKPKDKRLVQIANVLAVDPAWLMGLDVPMEPAAPAGSPAPAAIQAPLRPDEKELLSYYNLLDAEDRAEARGYIKGLVQSEKYRVGSRKDVG